MNDDLLDALHSEPVPPPTEILDGVTGWLTVDEEAALHLLGRLASSPILEVGPWLGRSTVCIASGIAERDQPVPFTTVELNPGVDNWQKRGDVWDFVPDLDMPPLGGVDARGWKDIGPVISHPLGVVGQLEQNLERAGVASLVTVVVGDVRTVELDGPFGCIFSDTMHSVEEIERYGEAFRGLLADGGVFACHDMTPENRQALGKVFDFSWWVQIDALFVGRVR